VVLRRDLELAVKRALGRSRALVLTGPRQSGKTTLALEQVLRLAKPDEAYFRATHQGAQRDLLMLKDSRRVGPIREYRAPGAAQVEAARPGSAYRGSARSARETARADGA